MSFTMPKGECMGINMLKKVSTLSIAILAAANVFAANVWDGSVAEAFTAGKGTVAEPYQISNGAELALFAQKVTGGDTTLSAVLTDDIYLNENTEQYATWGKKKPANVWPSPIGSYTHRFQGTFDGRGYKVYGAYQVQELNNSWNGFGFFGTIGDSAVVKNLGVEHSYVSLSGTIDGQNVTTNPHVAVFVGIDNGATFTNISVSGKVNVSATNATNAAHFAENGCFAGYIAKKFTIVNVAANCEIESAFEKTSTGASTHSLGGFIGKTEGTGFIENVYSRSKVTNTSTSSGATHYVGGLIGHMAKATDTLYNAYYDISVAGSENAPTALGQSLAVTKNVASKTSPKMKSEDFANLLGAAFTYTSTANDEYPQPVVFEGASAFDGGDGTESSPYLIGSAKALRAVSGLVNGMNAEYGDKHYKMTANVELNEDSETYKSWETTPPEFSWFQIGRDIHPKDTVSVDCNPGSCGSTWFRGVFDGAGHSVKGLYLSDTTNGSQGGLFNKVTYAVVKNVGVEKSFISVKGRAGGIAGVISSAVVDSCYNKSEIRSMSQDNGGLVGVAFYNSTISNSYNTGNLITTTYKRSTGSNAGIVGEIFQNTVVRNCWNSGDVKASVGIGGIVGLNDSSTVENVYNRGMLTADSIAAGICYYLRYSATLKNAYHAGKIVQKKNMVKSGGVVGLMVERTSPKVRNIVSDSYFDSQIIAGTNPPTAAIGTTAGTVTNTSALPTATMTTGRFAIMLGNAYKQDDAVNDGYPTFLAEGETYGVKDIFAGGDGSEGNPFLIATATQLRNMEYLVNKKNKEYGASHYKLIADIVLNENTANYTTWNTTAPANTWTPMGSDTTVSFKGVFDGGNYSISGIYTNATFSGLFGVIGDGAIVKNVTVKESLLKTTNRSGRVGGIAGYSRNATIENVLNEGNVYGLYAASVGYDTLSSVGGIVGRMNGGLLKDVSNKGSIEGKGTALKAKVNKTLSNSAGISVGGIAGVNDLGSIENASNYGSVNGKCVSMDTVWSKVAVGGITGGLNSATLKNVENHGTLNVHGADSAKVAQSWPRMGGIVGAITSAIKESSITKCANTGDMTGLVSTAYAAGGTAIGIGGIAGRSNGGAKKVFIQQCRNEGNITSTSKYAKTANYVGGIVGYMENTLTIENSYATGKIKLETTETSNPKTATVFAGGISSNLNANGVIKGSYFYGTIQSTVSATTKDIRIGGIVGNNAGSIVGSYFDQTVAGFTNVTGNNTGTLTKALALTTENMQTNEFAWKLNTFGGDSTNTSAFTRYNDYPVFADESYLPIYRVVFDDEVKIYNHYTSHKGYVDAPSAPDPAPGKMFVGWTDGDKYMLQNYQVINKDMTLYALFTMITEPIYFITFVDGSEVYVKATETTGMLKTLPTAKNIPMGYHFDGWFDNETNKEVTTETIFTGIATVVAKYSANLYKITFLDYDGTEISSNNEAYGQKPKVPAAPSRAATDEYAYSFTGWDHEVVIVTEEATYTAVYDSTEVIHSSSSVVLPESSSSEVESSSSVTPSSSSVAPASSSSSVVVSSSSSVESPKSSTSEVKSSSSSIKSSSSSEAKSSSSTAKSSSSADGKSSSSNGKDAIVAMGNIPQFSLMTVGRSILISAARVGVAYVVLDLQGGVVMQGRVAAANFSLNMPRAATYLVRIGSQVQKVTLR